MTGGCNLSAVFLTALGMALLAEAACNRQQSAAVAFPASNEVAGWMKTSNVRTFEAADLWKYIDGEAEKYLKAGVQRASTADYKFQTRLEAVVDIFTMSNPGGAAEVFDSEPAADAKLVPLADGAHLFSQSLVFHKGRYLVRIVTYEESNGSQQALVALGQDIAQRLTR